MSDFPSHRDNPLDNYVPVEIADLFWHLAEQVAASRVTPVDAIVELRESPLGEELTLDQVVALDEAAGILIEQNAQMC